VFLGLLPLVAVAGLLATLALRSVPRPAAISRPELHYLPVLGVVAGAGVALASLSSGQLPIVVAGVLAGGALLVVSLRRLTPPGTLLARRGLPATILSRGLLTCSFFAGDAYVNDVRREINGVDAIRRWVEKEMVGDNVTMEPIEVIDHYGETIVRSRYDGTYDKTNLPAELVMTDYFTVRDGKIVSLKVIHTQPSPY